MEHQTSKESNTEVKTSPKQINTPSNTDAVKKSKGLAAGLAICAAIAICGIAFGIYGMVTSNDKSSEISNLKSQITTINSALATLESENNKPAEDDKDKTSETPANPYTTFADNLAKNYTGTVTGHYYHWDGKDNVLTTAWAEVDKNNHLTVTDSLENKVIAEADNTIGVYYVQIGNGGVPYFYLIKKDGTVARINLLEIETDKSVKDVSGYKNIVSIVQGADLYAWLIDIEGNLYRTF